MSGQRFENINFGVINSGTMGDVVNHGGSLQIGVSSEASDAARRTVDEMAVLLAELAKESRLQQRQVELLASDLARIHRAIAAPQPDQTEFKSAAGDLCNKLLMLGNAYQGVTGLGQGLKTIAQAFGWSLALPLL
ncbi:MAG: hypothetical protein ACT4N2_16040 [Hyphomicrobium sp.]